MRQETRLSKIPSTMILLFMSLLAASAGVHFSLQPPQNSFLVFSPDGREGNESARGMYLQSDCPSSPDQHLLSSHSSRAHSTRLLAALPHLHCAVAVRMVADRVTLDRPFVDVVAVADAPLLSFFKQPVCVRVQLTSNTAATVSASCHLSPFDESRHSCLIRLHVPFAWFGEIGAESSKKLISLSYTVSATCNVPFYDRPQLPITLLPQVPAAQTHEIYTEGASTLSLLSRANLTLSPHSLNTLFLHIAHNSSEGEEEVLSRIDIRSWLDERLEVVSVSALSPQWQVRVSGSARSSLHTTYVLTAKKGVLSYDGYVLAMLVRLRAAEQPATAEEPAPTEIHWQIDRTLKGNGTKAESPKRIVTKFRVTPDIVYALVPISKTSDLINVAVLSGSQTSTWMRVLTVSLGGITRDVTALSHCISAESRVLKTAPTCTSVYVDGSELRGHSSIRVHVHWEQWNTFIPFTVWYPKLPITVWLRDPVLNAVSDWPVGVWRGVSESKEREKGEEKEEEKKTAKHRRTAARQYGCSLRHQHSEVRVLASFQVGDERTGERVFLSGERDVLFDVTPLAADRLQSADRQIATVRRRGSRVLVEATGRGSTRILLRSLTPLVDYGSAPVVVSPDSVSLVSLSAVPVVDLQVSIQPTVGRRQQYLATAAVETAFSHRYQQGNLAIQLHYSDDHSEHVTDIDASEITVRAEAGEEGLVAVNVRGGEGVSVIALSDAAPAWLRLSVSPPSDCSDPLLPPLIQARIPLSIHFHQPDLPSLATVRNVSLSASPPVPPSSQWRMDGVLAGGLIVLAVFAVLRLVVGRSRAIRGYEKLVAPLLSRLSTSSASAHSSRDGSNEWVWLSNTKLNSGSIGSRYSHKSATLRELDASPPFSHYYQPRQVRRPSHPCHSSADSPSPTGHSHHSAVSYRGSEISVYMHPQPIVAVHDSFDRPSYHNGGGSWRAVPNKSRVRVSRATHLVDSSSEHNLSRSVTRHGSWRDPDDWHAANNTWNSAKHRRSTPGGQATVVRESIA